MVYALDAATFVVSSGLLFLLRPVLAGLCYARSRPELLGSDLADLAAMTLSYPAALFPFLAAGLHAS